MERFSSWEFCGSQGTLVWFYNVAVLEVQYQRQVL